MFFLVDIPAAAGAPPRSHGTRPEASPMEATGRCISCRFAYLCYLLVVILFLIYFRWSGRFGY